jgi:hypothetical protein
LRLRRLAIGFLAALASVPGVADASASTICELPHPRLVVQFHPTAGDPFSLSDIDHALAAGVHGLELDVRLRPADQAVVCNHSARGLADRPTLAESIDRILEYQGEASSVQRDGLQFFLVLDVKGDSPAVYAGILEALRRYARHWSTAAGPHDGPRGITVVATGSTQGLAKAATGRTVDSLCIIEGLDYRDRIRNISPGAGCFQWISIQHPGERGRVRALHTGMDLAKTGIFNVRAYGCHAGLAECVSSGVDAVNADRSELSTAMALAASASVKPGRPR